MNSQLTEAAVNKLEIMDLFARYCYCLDRHDKERSLDADWIDCFTADARWEVGSGPYTGAYEGHGELAAFIATHTNDRPKQHLTMGSRIDLDGPTATATSYLVVVAQGSVGPEITLFGRYTDVLLRCGDGRWRFERRTIDLDAVAPTAFAVGRAE